MNFGYLIVVSSNSEIDYLKCAYAAALSIKNTQNKYFGGRVYGTSSETGLWFPDFANVAQAFKIGYAKVSTKKDLDDIKLLLSTQGPMIIDCICLSEQEIMPGQALKNGHQAALHDMYPFLSDKEMQEEIINKKLLDL
jgi:acetolactate synthase-1/2/3 large subunit